MWLNSNQQTKERERKINGDFLKLTGYYEGIIVHFQTTDNGDYGYV